VAPIPSVRIPHGAERSGFPLKGEGELRVGMKREIIDSDYEKRLASLRELQSQAQEELDALLLSHKGMISVLDRAFKKEL
jgi:hypothetical protein